MKSTKVNKLLITASSLVIALSLGSAQAEPVKAVADIYGPGIEGQAHLEEDGRGNVHVSINVKGDPGTLTPGLHGTHIHAIGACSPTFAAAGGHFDPGPNGNPNPVTNHPYHMGDIPNLEVNENGVGHLSAVTSRVSLSPSDVSLFDADGSAIIIHQGADQRSCNADPVTGQCTGASGGARIACGVIRLK